MRARGAPILSKRVVSTPRGFGALLIQVLFEQEIDMKTPALKLALGLVLVFSTVGISAPGFAAAVDEEAAKALFKRNDCGKCHAPSRDKKGPALSKIAKEAKGKPGAEKEMADQLTKSPKVKLLDSGKEEEHKAIDTKDMREINNLVQWILTHNK